MLIWALAVATFILVKMVSYLAEQPNATVPQACGDWAGTQAAYDFWANPHIQAEAIRDCHQQSTIERVKQHETILAIQDTTELNFTHHAGKKGMGYLDSRTSRGLKVNSVFCISATGVPLGVLNQQVWARDISNIGKKHSRHKRETKDKESQPCLLGALVALPRRHGAVAGLAIGNGKNYSIRCYCGYRSGPRGGYL